jgi:hypothetical protein
MKFQSGKPKVKRRQEQLINKGEQNMQESI